MFMCVVGEGGGLLRRWLRQDGSGGRSLGCACGERVVVLEICVCVFMCVYVCCGRRRWLLQGWLRQDGSGGRSLGCACGEWVVVSRNMCVSFYVCLCVLWREDGAAAEINAARRAETKLCL